MVNRFRLYIPLVLLAALQGCAQYAAPGGAANFGKLGVTPMARDAMTDHDVRTSLDRKPLAAFPAAIATVRVQEPCYRSYSTSGIGVGNYSVVTTREAETNEQMERLAKLPKTRGIAPLNSIVLKPYASHLESDLQLRQAAADVQADLLLIYTFDTQFKTEDKAAPLTVLTLGLSPNKQVRLTTTASAVLMDTRNGYVYGLAEATTRQNNLTNAWQNDTTIDETRRKTEAEAFAKLVGEVEGTWKRVIATYAPDGTYPTVGG
jgi:hypothetical protein